jgi:phosphoglycerol transferase MdoB-like AlkP superfamily enzyme
VYQLIFHKSNNKYFGAFNKVVFGNDFTNRWKFTSGKLVLHRNKLTNNMISQLNHVRTLLKRLGIILLAFMLFRILFYIFNYSHFGIVEFSDVAKIFYGGLKFDLSAILYFNIPVVFLALLPFPFRQKKWYRTMLKSIFFIVNAFAFAIAISDFEYYKFNNKRLTIEIFDIVGEGTGFFFEFVKGYWHVFVMFFAFIAGTEILYRKTSKNEQPFKENFFFQFLILLFGLGLTILIIRGDYKGKPLTPINAADYVDIRKAPLVTNSPFTLLLSFSYKGIDEKNFFEPKQLSKIFNTNRQYHSQTPVNKENVVIIILESFSTEYIGSLNNYKGYTPFLDTIVSKALVMRNTTANAERSNKGISCILASMPALMDEAFVSSVYQDNCLVGLGTCLKEMGYHTSFFHGGTNGTMNFNSFAGSVGIDHYYGRSEFNNEKYFDGGWGIYDEEFLQYFAKNLNSFPQPFFSTVFTLSSHHPFPIPAQYKGKFPKGSVEVLESIGYTDYALGRFFEVVSKQPWFNNTLFVITADHPFQVDTHFLPEYKSSPRMYAIPLLFYKPTTIKTEIKTEIVDQIDILPSILDHVGYPKRFKAFGHSIFADDDEGYGFQYQSQMFQIFDSTHVLYFNGNKSVALYNYKNDPNQESNLFDKNHEKQMTLENKIKAIIQTHNHTLIKNDYCE